MLVGEAEGDFNYTPSACGYPTPVGRRDGGSGLGVGGFLHRRRWSDGWWRFVQQWLGVVDLGIPHRAMSLARHLECAVAEDNAGGP